MRSVRITRGGALARGWRAGAAGLVLGALTLAAPARAELAPPLAALLAACMAENLSLGDRLATARAAGWADLPVTARDAAAQALAPWALLSLAGFERVDALEPDHLAENLAHSADRLGQVIAAQVTRDHWLALPDGAGLGRILDARGSGAASHCEVSGPIAAEDVAQSLDLQARRIDGARMTLNLFDLPAAPTDRGAIVSHILMTAPPGWPAIAPILITPLMPRPVRAP